VHRRTRRLAVALGVAAVAAVGVAALPTAGAQTPGRADELRHASEALAVRSRAAVLELYAIQSQVRRAQSELAAVRGRAREVARERAAVARRLAIARRSNAAAQAKLAARLRALYEQGGTDPVSIILGAESIEDALAAIDGLGFAASHDRTLVVRTRLAREALVGLQASLGARARRLAALERQAAARAAALAEHERDGRAYLASLARDRQLNDTQIAALERQAAAAHARSAAAAATVSTESGTVVVETEPAADPGPAAAAPPAAVSGAELVVSATAYAIRGRTATGLATAPGVAAVDPAVIPLGTRFYVPGYGEAIAADVGSAVRGYTIDLWFPTLAEARAWGRRTVTIVVH
jgi:peptidoglycan DL-endopeptidase CwlO